ncbi:Copper transport protein [Nymphaea thermarum]|nr:Copper transport protein [Nymphaea thermarum]
MKTSRMADIFCHSVAATAICMATDRQSVAKPGRLIDRSKLLDIKYSRLIEPKLLDTPSSANKPQLRRPRTERIGQQQMRRRQEIVRPTVGDVFQVVDMRVSLHCQGCAGKVKKHLTKMEGVTSFSIDLETKKVTVRGHVSPIGVLESVSRVKKAEFWATQA